MCLDEELDHEFEDDEEDDVTIGEDDELSDEEDEEDEDDEDDIDPAIRRAWGEG